MVVRPQILGCLGATAAQALLAKEFRVSRQRGVFVESALAPWVMATVRPSAILRAPGDERRRVERQRLVENLMKVAAVLRQAPS
jgi:uracil-DNA glycosylase